MATEAKTESRMEIDPRKVLLDSIRGTTVTIPNLRPIFQQYTRAVNPNYEALIPVVDSRLERQVLLFQSLSALFSCLVPNKKRLEKLKTADFALFASNWWPDAEFRELRIVAFLAIWLFLWDDALDEPKGEYADNFEAAQVYRAETLRFLADRLGLSHSIEMSTVVTHSGFDSLKGFGMQLKKMLVKYFLGEKTESSGMAKSSAGLFGSMTMIGKEIERAVHWTMGLETVKKKVSLMASSHQIVESFGDISDELKLAYTVEQRQNFFEDLKFYIATTEIEQRYKLDGEIPTLEQYWEARMGTSAVAACLAMIELVYHIKGPYRSTNHPSLKALSDETNIIVVIANDMLSLKKEIAQRQVDSLIPLSVLVYGGVQEAVHHAHMDLLASVARFDREAEKILSEPNTTGMSDSELRLFVEGCRKCWVGNFNWSLCTGRYGLGAIDQKDGSFSLSL